MPIDIINIYVIASFITTTYLITPPYPPTIPLYNIIYIYYTQLSGETKPESQNTALDLSVSDAFEGFLSLNSDNSNLALKWQQRLMKDAQTVGCCNGAKMAASLPVSAWPNSIYGSASKALLSSRDLAFYPVSAPS